MRDIDRVWYEEQIQLGLDDLKAGRVISDKEFRRNKTELIAEIRSRQASKKIT